MKWYTGQLPARIQRFTGRTESDMLVLSRRPDQEFCIPDLSIVIKILKVKGQTVRVGIDAPEELRILRNELLDEQFSDRKIASDPNATLLAAVEALRTQILGQEYEKAELTLQKIEGLIAKVRNERSLDEFMPFILDKAKLPAA